MLYSDYITAITDLLDETATVTDATAAPNANVAPTSTQAFNDLVPRSIEYIENRLQKDLDLINTYVIDETAQLAANSGLFTLPTASGTFVVVTQVYPIIGGVKQPPLLPTSLEYLNWVYPDGVALSGGSIPQYFAPFNGTTIKVGPGSTSSIYLGVVGTQRFVPLSAAAPSNFLTVSMPELYIALGAKWWFENYQRDGGQGADDPSIPKAWEQQYLKLMTATAVEEFRKKFQSQGWSARLPSPVAAPAQI